VYPLGRLGLGSFKRRFLSLFIDSLDRVAKRPPARTHSTMPPSMPPPAALTPAVEHMQNGLMKERLQLAAGSLEWLIGRSQECNLTINHPTISRKHARVHLEDGAYYITDLGSVHGTRVAGQPLQPKQPTRLFDGLQITLGDHKGELVPSNMMAAVMAAMRVAQEQQAAKERRKQDLEDADDDDSVPVPAPTSGGAAAALDEDDEMRAMFPSNFGGKQEVKTANLEKTHAANAAAHVLKLAVKVRP
jgi:pSer/pThr/pTyr-binding forkhead associated (FHA) protein